MTLSFCMCVITNIGDASYESWPVLKIYAKSVFRFYNIKSLVVSFCNIFWWYICEIKYWFYTILLHFTIYLHSNGKTVQNICKPGQYKPFNDLKIICSADEIKLLTVKRIRRVWTYIIICCSLKWNARENHLSLFSSLGVCWCLTLLTDHSTKLLHIEKMGMMYYIATLLDILNSSVYIETEKVAISLWLVIWSFYYITNNWHRANSTQRPECCVGEVALLRPNVSSVIICKRYLIRSYLF